MTPRLRQAQVSVVANRPMHSLTPARGAISSERPRSPTSDSAVRKLRSLDIDPRTRSWLRLLPTEPLESAPQPPYFTADPTAENSKQRADVIYPSGTLEMAFCRTSFNADIRTGMDGSSKSPSTPRGCGSVNGESWPTLDRTARCTFVNLRLKLTYPRCSVGSL